MRYAGPMRKIMSREAILSFTLPSPGFVRRPVEPATPLHGQSSAALRRPGDEVALPLRRQGSSLRLQYARSDSHGAYLPRPENAREVAMRRAELRGTVPRSLPSS